MRYINTKTGAIIDSSCEIQGINWKVYTENEKTAAEEVANVEVAAEEAEAEDEITKKDIMQELDAMGIEYSAKATKAELYALMTEGK